MDQVCNCDSSGSEVTFATAANKVEEFLTEHVTSVSLTSKIVEPLAPDLVA